MICCAEKYITVLMITGLILLAPVESKALSLDSGTATDGSLIFPKQMAMFCEISSHDANEGQKIEDCLNKTLALKTGSQRDKVPYQEHMHKVLWQLSADALDVSAQKKSLAGDAENEIDDAVGESSLLGASFSADDNIHKKQEQSSSLTKKAAEDMLNVIEILSVQMSLNAMENMNLYEFSNDSAPVEDVE